MCVEGWVDSSLPLLPLPFLFILTCWTHKPHGRKISEAVQEAWGPVMLLPCVLRSISTSAAFWLVNHGNSMSDSVPFTSRTKYTLAEAQVSWDSEWGKRTDCVQAETCNWKVVDDEPEMPGHWLRSTENEENWFFFPIWSPWHKSCEGAPGQGDFWGFGGFFHLKPSDQLTEQSQVKITPFTHMSYKN